MSNSKPQLNNSYMNLLMAAQSQLEQKEKMEEGLNTENQPTINGNGNQSLK